MNIGDTVSCPYCGRNCTVADVSSSRERNAGLCYLQLRCIDCNIRLEEAGVGKAEALRRLADKIKESEDNREQGPRRINPRPERRRRKPGSWGR